MGKTIARVFWLIIGVAGLGLGGYIVYEKQYFPVSHQSFRVEGGTELFVPNLAKLKAAPNGFNLLMSYGGVEWKDLLELANLPKEAIVTTHIGQAGGVKTISFCSDIDLFRSSKLTFDSERATVTETNKTYFIWRNAQFTVFSTDPIIPKVVKKEVNTNQGNADFFYIGSDGVSEAVKLTKDVKYSAFMLDEPAVKGKSVEPFTLLGVCPTDANITTVFGSSRFLTDAASLQGLDSTEHLNWVSTEMMYIKKDSFEVVVGVQNDGVLLKHLIMEAEQAVKSDTAIKLPIYFNNTEILPFSVNWNWQSLCSQVRGEMRYFATYNDFVFLTNNLQGMYWLLKNIQLGKTYDAFQLRRKIPSRIHSLTIDNNESGMAISSKTWVTRNRSINLAAMSNQSPKSTGNELVASIDYPLEADHLFLMDEREVQTMVVFTNNQIQGFSFAGEVIWSYELPSKPTVKPVLTMHSGKKPSILLVSNGNSLVGLESDGSVVESFSKKLVNPITNLQVYSQENKPIILVQTKSGLLLLNEKGNEIPILENSYPNLKYAAVQKVADVPVLVLLSAEDSLHVIDVYSSKKIGTTFYNVQTLSDHIVLSGSKLKPSKLKILTADNDLLVTKYFDSGLLDTIVLNKNVKPKSLKWLTYSNKWLLVHEFFDKMVVYNTLGLSEIEIAKPEVNLDYMAKPFMEFGVFAFVNSTNKQWYFTDEYGNLLMKKPIENNENIGVAKDFVLTKSQNSIYIYKIN